ncbi:N-methylhydantoinase B [Halarchaeum solikamskense]|uniref:hydantoinase B/oxoprolinase family protein n=1 Tax=Halarchaeum nitratireducens TaxID=489913 RepID=UPI001B3A8803|nr:hydantoinase B/oxoprolinase family protein [Halarchaeum solikamskense]MBP2252456.1 N-methylhydantoinase B [Halarchaeum solikamskense]
MTDTDDTAATVREQTAPLLDVDDPGDRIDPVTSRVVAGSLTNICDEMGHKLMRTSYSSIIRESEDFGCALLDERARQLCETDSTPLQMGPIPAYVRGVIDLFAERGQRFEPGDVVLHNDPYHGATHAPDFAVVVPVFYEDELTGFSVTTAHHLDVGADKPGTCIIETIDAYSESIRLDALKIVEGGERNETAWQLIADNIRTPAMVMGDVEAQISAARAGAERMVDLFEEHGHETVKYAGQDAMNYSEEHLRRRIESLPDGTYSAEGYLDGFPESTDPDEKDVFLAVDLTVEGSSVDVDLSRCDDQLDNRPINMPFEGTVVPAVLLVLRSTLLDTEEHDLIPQNHGITRPVSVHAPKGSIVNPRFPAPTIARFCPGNRIADLTLKALAEVVPEQTCAGTGNLKISTFSGVTDDEYWVYMDITSGSYGGRPGKDGIDAVDTLYANTRNNPIEDIESHYPLRVSTYELREDAEGAGRNRGGAGTIREIEFTSPGRVSIEGDGNEYPPWGFAGGNEGTTGAIVRNAGDENEESLPSKLENRPMAAGQRLRLVGPGAGGWGDPTERDPEKVRADVLDDLVSRERAREIYGVILTDDGSVDEAATRERRQALDDD